MKHIRRLAALLVAAAVLLAFAPASAGAATPLQGNTVTIAASQTVNDDIYAAGSTINVDGRVNGDVVAFGGTVNIAGRVTGNVIALGGTTTVGGKVDGTVRVAGGQITIDGVVGKDLAVAGGTVTLGSSARIGRDLLAGAGTITVNGHVVRNVQAGGGTLRINDGAIVGGNVSYTSKTPPVIAGGAQVHGTVQHHDAQAGWNGSGWTAPWSFGSPVDAIVGWIRMLIGLFILGLAVVLLAPGFSRRTIDSVSRMPWQSLGLGLALLITVPIAAVIVFVAGLFVGGWWLALMLMALLLLALPVSMVIAGLSLGHWIVERVGRSGVALAWELLVGLVILGLVSMVPWIGAAVMFVASLVGFGALVLSATGASRRRMVDAPERGRRPLEAGALT